MDTYDNNSLGNFIFKRVKICLFEHSQMFSSVAIKQ